MWSPIESGGGAEERAVPCGRGKHSATLLGGHVYVLGGRGAGGSLPLRDFWRYCLASGRWERLGCRGEPPPALQEHSASAHGARLYVFGGEPGTLSSETPLWIYDTETEMWRKLAGQPAAVGRARPRGPARGPAQVPPAGGGPRGRRGHSAHSLDDCLLIYGGYMDLKGSTNELWAFHYGSESWQRVRTVGGSGPARHRHAAALHAGRLYVHGGQCDLRDCADLWHYDIVSRTWSVVRAAARLAPSARSGHAGLRAGAHLYIFGGEANGHPTNELWRFHFATETWERIVHQAPNLSSQWPSARVDTRVLLVPAAGAGGGVVASGAGGGEGEPRAEAAGAGGAGGTGGAGGGLLRITRLPSFQLRRGTRCAYTVLAGEQDSTESLLRHDALTPISKSRSAYVMDGRPPAEAEEAERRGQVARDPVSVPDFADMVLPAPALAPAPAGTAKLVYLDSDSEREPPPPTVIVMPKSASVRFTRTTGGAAGTDDEGEMSTSDYASAERVNRVSGAASLGFCNPHYLGPDVRRLGAAATPDSGVGVGVGVGAGDMELQELVPRRARLHLVVVGGREPPHRARLHTPLSMWAYRLL